MTTEAIKLLPSPPFPVEVELNSDSESLTNNLIPGEYTPLATCEQFLQNSLNQSRANKIFRRLWFAGALGNFRQLHQQIMFRREIIVCEEPNLHLISVRLHYLFLFRFKRTVHVWYSNFQEN